MLRVLVIACALLVAPLIYADDEVATIRSFFRSDAEGASLRLFWAADAPSRAAFERSALLTQRSRCVELHDIRIRDLRANGDTATARVTLLLTKRERVTGHAQGPEVVEYNVTLARANDQWLIRDVVSNAAQLADALIAAPTADTRFPELMSRDLVRRLLDRAFAATAVPDRPKALRIAAIAEDIATQIGDRSGLSRVLSLRSYVTRAEGHWEEARTIANDALALARQSGDPDATVRALLALARSYDNEAAGELRPAILRQAKEFEDRVEDLALMVRVANGMEHEGWRTGDFLTVRRHLDDEVRLATLAGDRIGLAAAMLNLAVLYDSLRDPAPCIDYAKRAADLYADLSPGQFYPDSLMMESRCRDQRHETEAARALVERALETARRSKNAYAEAEALSALASHHLESRAYVAAERTARQAIALMKKTGFASDTEYLALTHACLGQRKFSAALEATQGYLASPVATSPLYVLTAKTLSAKAHRGLGRTKAALGDLDEAMNAAEHLRQRLLGNEQQRAAAFEAAAQAYAEAIDLNAQLGRNERALEFAERAKGAVLLETLRRGQRRPAKSMTAEEEETERRLESGIATLNRKLAEVEASGADAGETRRRLERARVEYTSFQTSLYARLPRLKAERGAIAVASPQQMTAALHGDAAFVEYAVGETRTIVFVVRSIGGAAVVRAHIIPIGRRMLESKIAAYREQLATRNLGHRRAARELDALLLTPLDALAGSARTLGIVADGPLWQLPFEALIDGEGRYRLERHTMFYAPSISVLLEMHAGEHRRRAGRVLAVGDPFIAAPMRKNITSLYRGADLAALPDARTEVQRLRAIYGPGTAVYVGAAATEARVREEIGDYNVLHFATHGILDDSNPMYSRLVLAEEKRAGGTDSDGLLEAWELMKLDLRADLVVLSACDSARGRHSAGEGMIGMTWAAFIAGARTTVASLWKVRSKSTSVLMVDFHREIHAHPMAKAEALRRAKLQMLHDPARRHPFYWAAFVLIGDPGTIY